MLHLYIVSVSIPYEGEANMWLFVDLESARKKFDEVKDSDNRYIDLIGPIVPGADIIDARVTGNLVIASADNS